MADCEPGRSERAESSRVKYSRLSLFRPARGCNCEGSAKADGLRKESTPCAVEGSKGAGMKEWVDVDVEDGSDAGSEDEGGDDEDCCCCCCWEDFRPVSASQIDILKIVEP